MKKKTMYMHICLLLTLLLGTAAFQRDRAVPCWQGEPVLRLHILANSDRPEDQQLKLQVRDALLPLFEAAESYESARAFLLSHGAQIQRICEETLQEAQVDYGAQLLLGVCPFPEKTYAGERFPAGEYEALRIVLGAGQGHNWWCVLFPPLCVITPKGETPAEGEGFVFESEWLAWVKSRIGGRP